MVETLFDTIDSQQAVIGWLVGASIAVLVATPIVACAIVVRLPAEYFLPSYDDSDRLRKRHPLWWAPIWIGKNALGVVLIVAGAAMLVTPGQGVLTLVVGVALLDFPAKRRALRWLATRRSVWRSMNWLRKRFGQPPFRRPG